MDLKVFALLLFVMCNQQSSTDSYRILGIFQHPGNSHFAVFKPLLRRLAEVGHDITVISHFPLENPPKKYRDISMYGSIPIWKSVFHFENFTYFPPTERISMHINTIAVLTTMGRQSCEVMMSNPEVKALKAGDFDVALVEDFNSDCGMGLIYKMKVPFLTINSHVMMSWTMDNLGLITNPSYVATHYLEHGRKLGSLEATESFIVSLIYKWSFYFFSQLPEQKIVEKHLGEKLPPLESIARNVSMILVNTYFPLNGANHLPPNVVEIGGIYHGEKKELPQDIKLFLDNSPEGVILFSMGSMLKATTWPEDKLKAFQEVFAELPHKVVWKWENDSMKGVPNNVKLVKWLPQYDILHHKNIKVFITHAGMLGLSETVKCGVPALTIPIYGDQFCNAAALEESGAGVYLKYSNVSKDSLRWALKVLLDPKMKADAEKLASLWNDRPMSAMNTAIYWIEHVARNGGSHLQPTSKDLPSYRYLMLDVFIILTLITIIVFYTIYKILATCFAITFKFSARNGNKKKNN